MIYIKQTICRKNTTSAMKISLVLLATGLISLSQGQLFDRNSCRNSQCRNDFYRAQNCCYNQSKCCQYVNNNNNGNNGYYPGNNGFNPGFGGQKPGNCPNNGNGFGNGFGSGIGSTNSGRKKRSPEQAPKSSSGNGRYNNGGGYYPGFNNGGQGFNPGFNNGGYNSCNSDSNCPGRQKCCYQYNGQRCVNPSIYG